MNQAGVLLPFGIQTGGTEPMCGVYTCRNSRSHKDALWFCYWTGGALFSWWILVEGTLTRPESVSLMTGCLSRSTLDTHSTIFSSITLCKFSCPNRCSSGPWRLNGAEPREKIGAQNSNLSDSSSQFRGQFAAFTDFFLLALLIVCPLRSD